MEFKENTMDIIIRPEAVDMEFKTPPMNPSLDALLAFGPSGTRTFKHNHNIMDLLDVEKNPYFEVLQEEHKGVTDEEFLSEFQAPPDLLSTSPRYTAEISDDPVQDADRFSAFLRRLSEERKHQEMEETIRRINTSPVPSFSLFKEGYMIPDPSVKLEDSIQEDLTHLSKMGAHFQDENKDNIKRKRSANGVVDKKRKKRPAKTSSLEVVEKNTMVTERRDRADEPYLRRLENHKLVEFSHGRSRVLAARYLFNAVCDDEVGLKLHALHIRSFLKAPKKGDQEGDERYYLEQFVLQPLDAISTYFKDSQHLTLFYNTEKKLWEQLPEQEALWSVYFRPSALLCYGSSVDENVDYFQICDSTSLAIACLPPDDKISFFVPKQQRVQKKVEWLGRLVKGAVKYYPNHPGSKDLFEKCGHLPVNFYFRSVQNFSRFLRWFVKKHNADNELGLKSDDDDFVPKNEIPTKNPQSLLRPEGDLGWYLELLYGVHTVQKDGKEEKYIACENAANRMFELSKFRSSSKDYRKTSRQDKRNKLENVILAFE